MTTEQEAFEKAFRGNIRAAEYILDRDGDGYKYPIAQDAWAIYQASRQDSMAMIAELVGVLRGQLQPHLQPCNARRFNQGKCDCGAYEKSEAALSRRTPFTQNKG